MKSVAMKEFRALFLRVPIKTTGIPMTTTCQYILALKLLQDACSERRIFEHIDCNLLFECLTRCGQNWWSTTVSFFRKSLTICLWRASGVDSYGVLMFLCQCSCLMSRDKRSLVNWSALTLVAQESCVVCITGNDTICFLCHYLHSLLLHILII